MACDKRSPIHSYSNMPPITRNGARRGVRGRGGRGGIADVNPQPPQQVLEEQEQIVADLAMEAQQVEQAIIEQPPMVQVQNPPIVNQV